MRVWAFCYLRSTDGQIAMDSTQGLLVSIGLIIEAYDRSSLYINAKAERSLMPNLIKLLFQYLFQNLNLEI